MIHPDKEPITPFINRILDLWENRKVSTILVSGSSGSYFHVAHLILQADHYKILDITETAKKTAAGYPFEIPSIPPLAWKGGRRRLSPSGSGGQRGAGTRNAAVSDRSRGRSDGGRDDRPLKIKVQGKDQLLLAKSWWICATWNRSRIRSRPRPWASFWPGFWPTPTEGLWRIRSIRFTSRCGRKDFLPSAPETARPLWRFPGNRRCSPAATATGPETVNRVPAGIQDCLRSRRSLRRIYV